MKYLLDTCTISEIVKAKPSAKVVAWLNARTSADLYLSVLTVGEIRKGIEMARPRNVDAANRYEAWLDSLVAEFADRIIPFDQEAAQTWGRLQAAAPTSDVEDSQISAIALSRGLTVVTRNVSDFEPFGVPIVDPF